MDWLELLNDEIAGFVYSLRVPDRPGRFLPCLNGATEEGRHVSLGFSCLALRLYYTLRLWEELPAQERQTWIAFLKSFQIKGDSMGDHVSRNAFVDASMIAYLTANSRRSSRRRFLMDRIFGSRQPTYAQKVIIAETKQAIATLEEIGDRPQRPYRGFPTTPSGVADYLQGLDWARPWDAGGQASALVVFLKTQSHRFLREAEVHELLDLCTHFFESLVDVQTGAYFTGSMPAHGELVNGAMKLLTALQWLEVPIHYPEQLIDTCLEHLPPSEGCHLVDAIYVLHRCRQETQHNRAKIEAYCTQVMEMIMEHRNRDGGFSYHVGRSQTTYYGVPISHGLAESDIHGTCLLAWAIAMILEILECNTLGWRVIKP